MTTTTTSELSPSKKVMPEDAAPKFRAKTRQANSEQIPFQNSYRLEGIFRCFILKQDNVWVAEHEVG